MTPNTKEDILMHERMATVQTKVELIMTNHLPHIEKKLDRIGTQFWAIVVLLVSALVGIAALNFK